MRLRLFHKLFVSIVVASLASIVVFGASAHWYFNRSFVRYLNEERAQHMTHLAADLAAHYEQSANWDLLRDDRRAWHRLMRRSWQDGAMAERGLHGPPGLPRRLQRRSPITLYDAEQRNVVGKFPFAENAQTLPLEIDGQTVGWVGMAPLRAPAAPRDVRFAKRQVEVLALASLVACMLSIVVAYVTARRLAAPVRRISSAARDLSGGDFETRLPPLGRDEIGQLGEDFNVLARTLQHNESARRRWFADVSHELRTPLAIMRGALEAVADGIRPNDARVLKSLDQETQRIEQLVEDLYDLARADIGTLDYEFARCSPGAIVTQVVNRFAHRFALAELEYDYDIDPRLEIMADGRRLAQLLENILENCCRYVVSPGRIHIAVRADGNAVELRIEDSGPLPDTDDLQALFEPLTRQEPSRNRSFGGSGLGLAICKRIVTGHEGTITASVSDLGGLAIVIRLPTIETK
jgi:two-component system sensor histidine kinase BaeS